MLFVGPYSLQSTLCYCATHASYPSLPPCEHTHTLLLPLPLPFHTSLLISHITLLSHFFFTRTHYLFLLHRTNHILYQRFSFLSLSFFRCRPTNTHMSIHYFLIFSHTMMLLPLLKFTYNLSLTNTYKLAKSNAARKSPTKQLKPLKPNIKILLTP